MVDKDRKGLEQGRGNGDKVAQAPNSDAFSFPKPFRLFYQSSDGSAGHTFYIGMDKAAALDALLACKEWFRPEGLHLEYSPHRTEEHPHEGWVPLRHMRPALLLCRGID